MTDTALTTATFELPKPIAPEVAFAVVVPLTTDPAPALPVAEAVADALAVNCEKEASVTPALAQTDAA
jgi:hypothetical protein